MSKPLINRRLSVNGRRRLARRPTSKFNLLSYSFFAHLPLTNQRFCVIIMTVE